MRNRNVHYYYFVRWLGETVYALERCNLLKKASASIRKIRPSEKDASVNVRARKVLKKQTKEWEGCEPVWEEEQVHEDGVVKEGPGRGVAYLEVSRRLR